jgi:indole-3-glycerol phosphate synthase
MINRLDPIIKQKQIEVAILQQQLKLHPEHAINKILRGEIKRSSTRNFKRALQQSNLAVIAEIKRKSPSKGALADIADPILLANQYVAGRADALSILTDEKFFGGHLNDLTTVIKSLHQSCPPVLRKDFMIDEIQIAEAIAAGADAILCIVAVHGDNTKTIINYAKKLGIDVLVEVHDKVELDIALASDADIIGINNRNLKTFEVNLDTALQLKPLIPDNIVTVAESGIETPEHAVRYREAGFNAVLIGEALVKSNNPQHFIRACQGG